MLFVMQHRRLLVTLVLAAGLASCRRAPVLQPAPKLRQASAAELAIYRVLAAKGEATRAKRLDILIDASARGLKLQSPTKIWDPKGGS